MADSPHLIHGLTQDQLRDFLVKQDPAWLVEELLRVAGTDPILAARLQQAAGAKPSGLVDLSRLYRRLASAIEIDDFIEYRGTYSYTAGIDEVLNEVEQLIGEGFPDAAIEAVEFALPLLEEASHQVDDSNGSLGATAARTQQIHLDACVAARPDPVNLARQLANWALDGESETFLDAASQYAEVLGTEGLAAFEEVVDTQFQALPRLEPGQDRHNDSWTDRFRVTHLQETLAAQRGVDAVVEVLTHDLSSPYRFLRIAQVLADDGRTEDALAWIARSRAAFGERDTRSEEFAAGLHAHAGRPGEATQISWDLFEACPALSAYQRLMTFAQASGDREERRQAALDVLRRQPVLRAPAAPPPSGPVGPIRWGSGPGHSTLVEVLLWEQDADGAWQAAQDGGCGEHLRLRLARARAEQHPADAVPILQHEIVRTIEGANRSAYQGAANLAKELQGYCARAGTSEEFATWIRVLRSRNTRRWALRQEFDSARLPS